MKTCPFVLPLLGIALYASASQFDGSRTLPVHRIPITAEDGERIIPTVPHTMPISTLKTCGACHDYAAIHSGTHFGGAGQGRATEPWIVVDPATGTQVPEALMDLSAWEFTRRFGAHLPGGGRSDPADKLADPEARWEISGGLEINCLHCHNLSPRQDLTEWAKQIGRENFRWAATAASGLGEVEGMASRMPDWWTVYDGANPDDQSYAVPPSVDYDSSLFDSNHRAWFDIGKPQDRNCLQCHSVHPVGTRRMDVPEDVHAASGLSCVDCHRNGIDHQILRGTTDAMSCAACHMEGESAAGQAGAPIAHHRGLPPVHFEELTCTACHSGIAPDGEPKPIRTSRANRLGIYGRAQWFTESPFIVEPVFVRNNVGKIEPRRMMWPAFWADAGGNPLPEKHVAEAATGILDADRQIGDLLARLGLVEGAPGEPLFVAGGKTYALNVDGGLDRVGETDMTVSFVWDTGSNLVSSIPDFDVTAETIDYDAEGSILAVINALGPDEIVLVYQGRQFSKSADGYLEGSDSKQPNGWYRKDGAGLYPPFVERAVVDLVGSSQSLNEEQVMLMLQKLGDGATYIANGKMFRLDGDALTDIEHQAAQPISWALGHDVRGTAQSLGAKSCRECHADDSSFLFGTVTATGPLLTDRASSVSMHEFEGINGSYNKLFGASFKIRKAFKYSLANIALLLALIALAVGLPFIHKWVGKMDGQKSAARAAGLTLIIALAVLAVTGFIFGWPVSNPLEGFPLLSHVGFGMLYALALLVYSVLRAGNGGFWCWLLLLSGIPLMLSIIIAMFPVLGTEGQHAAIVVHRIAAIVSVIAGIMEFITNKKNVNQ